MRLGSSDVQAGQGHDTGCMGQKMKRGKDRIKVGTLHKLGGGAFGSSLSMGTVFYVIKIFQSWADMMAIQHVTTVNATEWFTLK